MEKTNSGYLMITQLFLPTKGGTAVWFDEVYKRKGGKEIHIVTDSVLDAHSVDSKHPNQIHRVQSRRHPWLRPESLFIYLKYLWLSLGLCFSHQFKAIHAGRVLPEGLVGLICARVSRLPLLVYAHGEEITTWRQWLKHRVMSWVYKNSDHIIANSDFTFNELIKLGIHPKKIKVVYPGVDISRFKPGLIHQDLHDRINLLPEENLLLSVGRLSRRKGFDTVIKSLPALRDSGVIAKYVIIGIGEDQHYLTALANKHNVSDIVYFLGHVPMEDLPRWYNACDIFVMPNRNIRGDTEGFGMVFIEAAACKKTSISGNSGGVTNAVLNNKTGLNIDGNNIDSFLQAIIHLLNQEDYKNKLETASYQRANKELSWHSIVKQTFMDS